MAQSRNPSERNKVGEKEKKKKAWWESALDAAVDFGVDFGKTAASNVGKVSEFGGNMVKGLVVDPVVWAAQNPAEVGKTFINPERANEWLYDNLFAGKELDRIATGDAGLSDAAIAAMALFPFGRIADDAIKAAVRSGARAPEIDEVISAAQSAFEGRGKNPFGAMYSGVRGETRAKRNVMQAMEGTKTGRVFEAPVGNPVIDVNELDDLLAATLGDTAILEKGGSQYMDLLKGLQQRAVTNESRMGKILQPIRMLEDAMRGTPKNTPEYRALANARKRLIAEDEAKMRAAVKAENKYSNRR